MARDQLEAFLKTVKGDPALLERFSSCPNLNAIAELGATMGYSFSGVELVQHQAEATLKLSDADLEASINGERPALLQLAGLFGQPAAAMAGGLPLLQEDSCLGAIGVSGMTPEIDSSIATAGVKGLGS